MTPSEAKARLARLVAASSSFAGFVELHHPGRALQPFHQRLVNALDRLERGTLSRGSDPIRRILVNWPPRHGKSEYTTKLFPAYFVARDSRRNTLGSAYNSELADDFGMAARSYLDNPLTLQAFQPPLVPIRLEIDKRQKTKDLVRTMAGGQIAFTGINGTTTGRPANLLVIDDPIKGRTEADSMTSRNRVWDFYVGSLLSRRQPLEDQPPIEIVILTRWHPDDLAGRIMQTNEFKNGEWLHIEEKAIVDSAELEATKRDELAQDDPMYVPSQIIDQFPENLRTVKRAKRTALWEKQKPLKELLSLEAQSPREFAALYQQNPYIKGGNIIKANWWGYYTPNDRPNAFLSVIISADTAFERKSRSDFSVLQVWGMDHGGDIYLLHQSRDKWDYPQLKAHLKQLFQIWKGKGLRGAYVEDAASGKSLIQDMQREPGMVVLPYPVRTRNLEARVHVISPVIEAGRVHLPKQAPWLDAFVQEATQFPSATHDDQISAMSIALDIFGRITVDDSSNLLMPPLSPAGSLNQAISQNLNQTKYGLKIAGTAPRWGELKRRG